jgi:NAD(P)-dependent dehydrogenase (short-subunit alcohol dehydrogenase family)
MLRELLLCSHIGHACCFAGAQRGHNLHVAASLSSVVVHSAGAAAAALGANAAAIRRGRSDAERASASKPASRQQVVAARRHVPGRRRVPKLLRPSRLTRVLEQAAGVRETESICRRPCFFSLRLASETHGSNGS